MRDNRDGIYTFKRMRIWSQIGLILIMLFMMFLGCNYTFRLCMPQGILFFFFTWVIWKLGTFNMDFTDLS